MSPRLSLLASAAVLGLGISAVALAQTTSSDPYTTYYQSNTASQGDMAGGPLARPMPASVSEDLRGGPLAVPRPADTYGSATPVAAPTSVSGGQYYQPAPPAPQVQTQNYRAPAPAAAPSQGKYYGRSTTVYPSQTGQVSSQNYPANQGRSYQQAPAQPQFRRGPSASPSYGGQAGPYQGYPQQGKYQSAQNGGPYGGPNARRAPQKRSWWQRLGFGNTQVKTDGYARLGDAGVWRGEDSDLTNELVADAMVRSEVSAITDGGLEYGLSLKLRGQRDRFRRGFGGSTAVFGAGDCPPGEIGCQSVTVDGGLRAVRGHTGQLYNFGPSDTREHALALEGAHIFLRSRYGDISLGRDDGAAALFSGGAPSTLPLARSSNSRVDYTGLDMTKTVNDASGFAEKITYTSPRLLGDTIGVGVQFGVSYAPSTEACGVDYCVRGNDVNNLSTPITAQLSDAVEFGVALDRTFDNGFGFEATANYATATETSGIAGFDDLQSWGLGLDLSYYDFTLGTSYLLSNNGWAGDGDYSAFDVGLTWKPNDFGLTASYGQSTDDLASAEGSSAILGVSYDINRYTFGTGVQYTKRDVPVFNAVDNVVNREEQDAIGLFIEGAIKF